MKYLIVSADDLGLSESINRGIIKSFEEGIVTNLNMIPSGGAFYDAAALLRTVKPKEIGAHLALTETSPVSLVETVPALTTRDGRFHKSYPEFLPRLILKRIDGGQIYAELKNQMERLKTLGIPITNLSSHQHIHMLPGILKLFVKLAKEYNVPSIRCLHGDSLRYPYSLKRIYRRCIMEYFDMGVRRALDNASIRHTGSFLGFLDGGNIREELLMKMLDNLPEGTTELVAHPGFISAEVLDRCIFHRNCETDLAALTSRRVKKAIADKGIKLITFGEFAKL
ncbi:MAG: ChbG/HpnK family deacetylase [Candidatus Omnitrophota bacterium]